jgi:hypothetical protein
MVLVMSCLLNSSGSNIQQNCRNVHFVEPPASDPARDQAIGRTARLGQAHVVKVYNYLVRDSFDMRMLKNNLAKNVLTNAISFRTIAGQITHTAGFTAVNHPAGPSNDSSYEPGPNHPAGPSNDSSYEPGPNVRDAVPADSEVCAEIPANERQNAHTRIVPQWADIPTTGIRTSHRTRPRTVKLPLARPISR